MQNNVHVSVAERQMRDGVAGLIWNVTAPCRLEAELWLCKKDLPGGHCDEVKGSRQKLELTVDWTLTRNGHWVKTSCTILLYTIPMLNILILLNSNPLYNNVSTFKPYFGQFTFLLIYIYFFY